MSLFASGTNGIQDRRRPGQGPAWNLNLNQIADLSRFKPEDIGVSS